MRMEKNVRIGQEMDQIYIYVYKKLYIQNMYIQKIN